MNEHVIATFFPTLPNAEKTLHCLCLSYIIHLWLLLKQLFENEQYFYQHCNIFSHAPQCNFLFDAEDIALLVSFLHNTPLIVVKTTIENWQYSIKEKLYRVYCVSTLHSWFPKVFLYFQILCLVISIGFLLFPNFLLNNLHGSPFILKLSLVLKFFQIC